MASLHKHSSGRSPYWFAKFIGSNGKMVVKSTKQVKRDKAMELALEWQHQARLAREGRLTKGQAVKVLNEMLAKVGAETIRPESIKSFLDAWLKGKELAKSNGTYLRYSNTVNLFLASLGPKASVAVANVTARDIEKFRDEQIGAGKAASTVNVDLKTLRNAFTTARKRGAIDTNPIDVVEFPKERRNTKDTFTAEQIVKLLNAAKPEWKIAIMFGYYASMRLGDAVSVERGFVDREKKVIRYVSQKTKQAVECPLHPDLDEFLSKVMKKTGKVGEKLTPTLASCEVGGRSGLSRQFKQIMAAASIDDKQVEATGEGGRAFSKLSFHALRHTSVSALANAGVSAEVRKKISGHTDDAVHAGYTHLELQPLREGITKLPSVFRN